MRETLRAARCLCGKSIVFLRRQNARMALGPKRGAALALWGGVCEACGRGMDLLVERKPGNEVRRAG